MNLKDLVGFQDTNSMQGFAFFMQSKGPGSFSILKAEIECIYTLEQVTNLVHEALESFTTKVKINTDIELKSNQLRVAEKCRRGVANTKWNNTWFYKGASPFDAPIIVTHFNNKYAFYKVADFDKYGFIIEV